MSKYTKSALLLLFAIVVAPLFGQPMGELEGLAELMKTNNKFYVVFSVITIIFVGFFVYLIKIDRNLKKIEKNIDQLK